VNQPLARPGAGTGRREILEAAAAAFTRRGYASTSMDDIADLLGATKGRVYHYYRAKADIFLDVVLTGMDELIAGIEPLAAADDIPPADRLWRMVHYHAGLMMTRHSFQRVAIQAVEMRRVGEVPARQSTLNTIVDLRDRYEQYFADVIEEGTRQRVFRNVAPRVATKPVLGALNWISLWFDPERGDYASIQRLADEFADFIVGGLRLSRASEP